MLLENKLNITDQIELAKAEEKFRRVGRAVWGALNQMLGEIMQGKHEENN